MLEEEGESGEAEGGLARARRARRQGKETHKKGRAECPVHHTTGRVPRQGGRGARNVRVGRGERRGKGERRGRGKG